MLIRAARLTGSASLATPASTAQFQADRAKSGTPAGYPGLNGNFVARSFPVPADLQASLNTLQAREQRDNPPSQTVR